MEEPKEQPDVKLPQGVEKITAFVHPKRTEKVAICGFSGTSKDLAPYKDESWEIWGCNELYRHVPRLDVDFEIHNRDYPEYQDNLQQPDHLKWLRESKIPIYMVKHYDDIPMSLPYPIDAIRRAFPYPYFDNTISYMIALAIFMEYKEIGIWGVDMSHPTELYTQRSSVEYYIGIAIGLSLVRGFPKVTIPVHSLLLKTSHLYGFEPISQLENSMRARMQHYVNQHQVYAAQAQQNRDLMMQYLGSVSALDYELKTQFPQH